MKVWDDQGEGYVAYEKLRSRRPRRTVRKTMQRFLSKAHTIGRSECLRRYRQRLHEREENADIRRKLCEMKRKPLPRPIGPEKPKKIRITDQQHYKLLKKLEGINHKKG